MCFHVVVKILKRKKIFFLNVRLGTIFINQENEDVLHIAYVIQSIVYQKKFLVFSDGSNHDYHFITKESAEEFEEQFTCLGEHTKKLLSFSVPIEKEVARIDKKGKEITKTIFQRLQVIVTARFMANSSNLINNLSETIHKLKCRYGHNDKNVRLNKVKC